MVANLLKPLHIYFGASRPGKCCTETLTRLPKDDEPDDETQTAVRPDIAVVCDGASRKGCRGAPDLIVEVLSADTAAKDLTMKRPLYESRRIPEFWLVDPDNRLVQVYVLERKTGYAKARIFTDQGRIISKQFPGLEVHLKKVFPVLAVTADAPRNFVLQAREKAIAAVRQKRALKKLRSHEYAFGECKRIFLPGE
jgi:Uma2 family endonuclease